jgi:plasmid stability protein
MEAIVATLIIRNVPDDTHAKLKILAARRSGRASVEGLARSLLIAAAEEQAQGNWVDRMVARNQALIERFAAQGVEPISREEMDVIFARNQSPAEFPDFSGSEFDPPQ